MDALSSGARRPATSVGSAAIRAGVGLPAAGNVAALVATVAVVSPVIPDSARTVRSSIAAPSVCTLTATG